MHERLAIAALLALATTACGDGGDIDGTLGEVGEGVFRYACIEDGDARCNDTQAVSSTETSDMLGLDREMPSAIAVGARFDLTYVGDAFDDGSFLVVDVQPARHDLVTHAGGFVIAVPGRFAFLARNGAERRVVDFIHVEAKRATRLAVWHAQTEVIDSLTLQTAATADVAVLPVSEDDVALAGALGHTWTSSDASIVRIEGSAINEDEVRLVAVAAGSAILTVSQDGLTRAIDVTVSP